MPNSFVKPSNTRSSLVLRLAFIPDAPLSCLRYVAPSNSISREGYVSNPAARRTPRDMTAGEFVADYRLHGRGGQTRGRILVPGDAVPRELVTVVGEQAITPSPTDGILGTAGDRLLRQRTVTPILLGYGHVDVEAVANGAARDELARGDDPHEGSSPYISDLGDAVAAEIDARMRGQSAHESDLQD